MPISLAPFRYRRIEVDGPVAKLVSGPSTLWDGTKCYDAVAALRPDLRPQDLPALFLYEKAEGGGTNRSEVVARHMAVSEALERWAYFASSDSPLRGRLGFDIDDSTTGMAAFPGITNTPARLQACREAVERWTILEWWRGSLAATPIAFSDTRLGGIELGGPFGHWTTVILWADSGHHAGGRVYGFAAGKRREAATCKAMIELTRNARALAGFNSRNDSNSLHPSDLKHPNERRLIFFAAGEGRERFQERVEHSASGGFTAPAKPRCLVDAEVVGPWSRYATVWRVLFRHEAGPDQDWGRLDVFQF